jgi:membrane protease YdiL (CAAX protease family)
MFILSFTIGGIGQDMLDLSARSYDSEIAMQEQQQELQQKIQAEVTDKVTDFTTENAGLMLGISALLSLMAFSLMYAARRQPFFTATRLDAPPRPADALFGACAGFSSYSIIMLAIGILANFESFAAELERYESQMAFAMPDGNLIQSIIGIGIIAPIVEEVMFRGMVTHELGTVFPAKFVIAAQGVMFGIYHMNIIQGMYAVPLGILFGFCAYKSRSIWPAIAGHIAMNTVSLVLSTPEASGALDSQPAIILLFIAMSLAMFVCSVRYFASRKA